MQVKDFKHQPATVLKSLAREGQRVIAQAPVRILVPAYYETKGLVTLGAETYFLGYYAIVDASGHYGIDTAPTMIRTEPSSISRMELDEREYIVFIYEVGDAVIASTDVVKDETIGFKIFNEILSKGQSPWWMNYEHMCKVLAKMRQFTGSSVGDNRFFYEILAASFARNPQDRSLQWRQGMRSKADMIHNPPSWAPLRSVQYTASNTVAKLAGSRWGDGMISAINSPTTRISSSERVLRL